MTESELRTYEGEECGHTTEITFLVGEDTPVHAEQPFEQRTMGCPECATTNKFVWTELNQSEEEQMITHGDNTEVSTADEESESEEESLIQTHSIEDAEDESDEPTCVGKDGECSRTVDEEGDTCWQHAEA